MGSLDSWPLVRKYSDLSVKLLMGCVAAGFSNWDAGDGCEVRHLGGLESLIH